MFNERLRRKNTHATYLVRYKINIRLFVFKLSRLYKILLVKTNKMKILVKIQIRLNGKK
jgi:hypothetical protein